MTNKHDPDHNGHITLLDGRALDLRPMWITEIEAVISWQERDEAGTFIDQVREIVATIESAVTWQSWDGSLKQMSPEALFGLINQWRAITEDDALPPGSGADSETKSPAPVSPGTGVGSRSHSARKSLTQPVPGASRPGH